MIYIVVIAAIAIIPIHLGGYAHVFAMADQAFQTKGGATGIILKPAQFMPFATLALGSAMAAFMYPHTMTGVLSSSSADVVRKNAMLLPIYTILLGLIALMGYMALAAGISVTDRNQVVPALFAQIFPEWFVGFSFAAIAIGALVPAAIMSIGAATLFTRNVWKTFINPHITPAGEAQTAKLVSLVVKVGALFFIIFLPTQFAIDLQLLGGVWIIQTFPAVVLGLYRSKLNPWALLLGWAIGMGLGSWMSFSLGIKPVYPIVIGETTYAIYIGLLAGAANLLVAVIGSLVLGHAGRDQTVAEDYVAQGSA
jgi:SSS family solute:Na+ symporter